MPHTIHNVIPAKAGIQFKPRLRRDKVISSLKKGYKIILARYRSRWIPAFAGMTWLKNSKFCSRNTGLIIVLLLTFTLTACGKRAAHVDPPPDLVKDEFPRVYPDPKTDPSPAE